MIAALATAGGGGDEPGRSAARVQVEGTTGEPPRGLAVFAAQGCGSCHAFEPANAKGCSRPTSRARSTGRSKEYIRTSIVGALRRGSRPTTAT